MYAGRAIWWVFTRLNLCGYQPLCAVYGSNLAMLNLSVYSAALRGGCSTVDCALCRQLNKRTLLLLLHLWRQITLSRSVLIVEQWHGDRTTSQPFALNSVPVVTPSRHGRYTPQRDHGLHWRQTLNNHGSGSYLACIFSPSPRISRFRVDVEAFR